MVPLRLIKVILDSGEIEVLATSLLDGERYPATLFKALYHLRWGVETDYRQLKQSHELQNFSGRTPQAVQQDFYSQVLLNNLASSSAPAPRPPWINGTPAASTRGRSTTPRPCHV